ncbi:forkhead box protein M1 isoform 1-T2 [Clarias gariepinus]|uniref:forkhead box protein M1 n=1 Tax=Clarias gariepinus TaxID=13013 RepID=UPI00234DA45A|nr:forkhead box protein M1 [Clarias gariepinus]XP_053364172.1 forkhead box protein M1 [Clarias gariepinus]
MNRTMESPRRPIILKRRKLPFQRNESEGPQSKARSTTPSGARSFPDGICLMDHPTMPDTQVVVIPKSADLQSVIDVLTVKGKEHGAQGPTKFILLSGSNGSEAGVKALGDATSKSNNNLAPEACATGDAKPLLISRLKNESDCSLLDDSLTNIQWLGKMDAEVASTEKEMKESNKENLPCDVQEAQQPEEDVSAAGKGPLSERPPYSYMAMIQFAINSKKNKMMTLKEIYNWIEDHFPYFRDVAKPGWKNSIRHNLSLHDMFVRESTPDGKISFWTIKPEANRCLTLDQVYKPAIDPAAPSCPQTVQVCYQQQQKRVVPEPKKATPCTTERKMKPLLPRTDSYLVPIQLPLTSSLFLSSSAALPLSTPQQTPTLSNPVPKVPSKRPCIAPKIPKSDSSSVLMSPQVPEVKEERVCVPVSAEPRSSKRKELSSSRRKQRLVTPSTEEPVLVFPESSFSDSGVALDLTALQEMELEPLRDPQLENETFKTPIKGSHPASSTPSKALEPWRITPLGKGSRSVLDFSPIRTPQRNESSALSLTSTPFKELQLFSSPRELLTSCSRELQTGSANRSLTEGLVLDTMNDSLSKILVDISFSCLDDDDLGMANLSWSQFIPDLK